MKMDFFFQTQLTQRQIKFVTLTSQSIKLNGVCQAWVNNSIMVYLQ
jgi:hypothetical protein